MRYVIIGTSAAGLAAAETLRRFAPPSSITLISEEPHLPYSRPLLTYLLGGEVRLEQVWLRGPDYFHQWGFKALLGELVVQVDPQARQVRLASGQACEYDRLLIASGARPRLLGVAGEDLPGVHTLRNLADWQRLAASLPQRGAPVTVVGAGPVGLKAAEALARRGYRVNLLEAESRPLPRLLDETAAALLQQALTRIGLDIFLNTRPAAFLGEKGRLKALALEDGRELPSEVALLAVGVTPRVEFLAGTGLAGAAGISVDPFLKTSHPDIYAAGDCIQAHHLITGAQASYQIWPAAVAQGQVAGANLAGAGRRYDGLLPQNSIALGDFKIITGGLLIPEAEEGEIFRELDPHREQYRRLVFQQGRLVGLTLVGQVNQAGLYFQVISQQLLTNQLATDPRSPEFHPGSLWG
jgi:nitrite reductase (NADH) large subunit